MDRGRGHQNCSARQPDKARFFRLFSDDCQNRGRVDHYFHNRNYTTCTIVQQQFEADIGTAITTVAGIWKRPRPTLLWDEIGKGRSRVLELGSESGTDRRPTVYPGSYVEYVQKLGHEAPGIYS